MKHLPLADRLLFETPEFETLKKNKVKLTDEERDEAMKADACWHPGNQDKPTCAIWKSVVRGKTYFGCNIHRAFNVRFHDFIKGTA